MVNELMEAKNNSELNRVTRRWTRYELIVIDEMAYVAMPETAALIQRCGHIFEAEEALLPS
jgi:DNA replication protein DnaC